MTRDRVRRSARALTAFALATSCSVAACRTPPPARADGRVADAASIDGRRDQALASSPEIRDLGRGDARARDLGPPDEPIDATACAAMTPAGTLYETYCTIGAEGICLIDHPPPDF